MFVLDSQTPKRKFDYKWVIVGICILIMLIGTGFVPNRGLCMGSITEKLGVSRDVFSLNDTLRFLTTAVCNLFFGFFISKFGSKKLICTGIVIYIGAFLTYSMASTIPMFYLAGMLTGCAVSLVGTTMIGSVINRWCKENTGTITGLAMASTGVGSAIASQVLTPIIEKSINGYKTAYRISALLLAILLVVVFLFYKEKQKEPGETAAKKKKKFRGRAWEGLSYSDTAKKAYFYAALICIFFTGFCVQGFVSVTSLHMKDVGMPLYVLKWAPTMHAIIFIFCKFGTGFMYDKTGLRKTSSVCTIASVITLLMMAMYTNSTFGIVLAFVSQVISSFAIPLETVMLPIYAGDLFGQKAFDKIMGIFVACNVAGYAAGVPAMNFWYRFFGSYNGILIINAFIMFAVFVALQFIITAAHKEKKKLEMNENETEEVTA